MDNFRSQFPILNTRLNGQDLIYLDSAATSQKPQEVIDSMKEFYTNLNASSHSVHTLGDSVGELIEKARQVSAEFINTNSKEIIFTSGATESLNLIANGFLEASIGFGDSIYKLDKNSEILICVDQHHSNILPWQRLATITGCKIVFFGITKDGSWDMNDFNSKLNPLTKIIAISNVSNIIGVIQDYTKIKTLINDLDIRPFVVLDATQAVSHFEIDVKELDCDFVVFSGHKIYGPTGVGVLYGKSKLLEKLPSYQVGGDMVESVAIGNIEYKESPYRFEAGTANFASIVGLNTALLWFIRSKKIIFETENNLLNHLLEKLTSIPGINILGNSDISLTNKIPVVSFNIDKISPLDIAILLDQKGICVRSGQHCGGILHEYLNISSSCRISLACFNTFEEIDHTINEIIKIINKLK